MTANKAHSQNSPFSVPLRNKILGAKYVKLVMPLYHSSDTM
jgi:hypothetical protein